jgi:hypothetical protein
VVGIGKSSFSMLICPNQSQRNTLVHRHATVQKNLGGRPRGGKRVGFLYRTGFGGPEPNHSMHVDQTCVCMCFCVLVIAIAIGPPAGMTCHLHIWPGSSLRGANSHVDFTGGNIVVGMTKPLLFILICRNKAKGTH